MFDAPNTLKDASSLDFEVFDLNGNSIVARTAANLVTDRLALGTYAPSILIPTTAPLGPATVRWYYEQATDPGNEISYDTEFEILPPGSVSDPLARAYAYVWRLREECIFPKDVKDGPLYEKICMASDLVEMYTGRFFAPEQKNVRVNGRRTPQIRLDEVIIGVGEVALDFGPLSSGEVSVEADDILVFNRHLTEKLTRPDDRDDPKIELFHIPRSVGWADLSNEVVFPDGVQNIRVLGVFGYTEPTPTTLPIGRTPRLIRRATELLTVHERHKLGEEQKRFKSRNRWRLLREEGDRSSYQLADLKNNPAAFGTMTGDPEIDQILSKFMRPPVFGAA